MANDRSCLPDPPVTGTAAGRAAEAPGSAALTAEQRAFAAEHHALVYAFLRNRNLDSDEFYDIAVLGYLQAVQRYMTQPALAAFQFSTIAWRAMRRAVDAFCRSERRYQDCALKYAQSQSSDADSAFDRLQAILVLHDLSHVATPEQYALVELRLKGCSMAEAARVQGVSVKRVRRLLKELYGAYL